MGNKQNSILAVISISLLLVLGVAPVSAKKPTPTPTPTAIPTPTPVPQTTGDVGTFSSTGQGQLPQALSNHSTVTANIGSSSYVYVLGGTDGTFQSTAYKSTVDGNIGNIGTFSTTNQTQLPSGLAQFSANNSIVGTSNYLYVLGGYNGVYQSSVYKSLLDSTSGDIGIFSSTAQAQLPRALSGHTSTLANIGSSSYLYVLGGYNGTSQSTVYKSLIDSTTGDVGTFSSTFQAQLPQALSNHSSVVATIGPSTYLYLLGGTNSLGNSVSAAYKATLNSTNGDIGSFQTTNQSQLPKTISSQTAVVTNIGPSTYLYVLGGKNASNSYSSVYKATINGSTGDIGQFASTAQAQLPQAVSGQTTISNSSGSSTYIYIFGGNTGTSNISTVYKSILHN